MTEWRLFPENAVPEFTTRAFFESHPRIAQEHQIGFNARMRLAVDAVLELTRRVSVIQSVVDLGCDDGELLYRIREERPWLTPLRGYTLGSQSVEFARSRGLDVTQGDFLTDDVGEFDLTVMTEVLEHLTDPHSFLKQVESPYLVVSSPSAETDEWHYEHHAWAWDLEGYRSLVEDAGWFVVKQDECLAGFVLHMNETRSQRFQVITARRQ